MTDSTRFKILLFASTTLVGLILSYSIIQEYVVFDIDAYLQRRSYYERVISKKGLSLHKGLYWKEKQ